MSALGESGLDRSRESLQNASHGMKCHALHDGSVRSAMAKIRTFVIQRGKAPKDPREQILILSILWHAVRLTVKFCILYYFLSAIKHVNNIVG